MAKKLKPMSGSVSPNRLILIRLLMVAAAILAVYLLRVSLAGSSIPGCAPGSGCDEVLHSSWAYWFNLPVSALALITYLVVLLGTFWLSPRQPSPLQRKAWIILFPAASLIILAAVWFVVIQLAVIKTFCPFCMITHAVGFVAALLLLFSAPLQPAPEKSRDQKRQVFVTRKLAGILLLLSLAAFGGLVAGQTLAPRQNYIMEVSDGKFQIDVNDVPVLGKPSAPKRMVSLFDYTCHYCRILHGRLNEIHKTFQDQLCIVSLPMPLDSRCNHLVKRDHPDHVQACDYAKLGLAVWRADREKFNDYTDWIFSPQKIPSLEAAKIHAQTLVGQAQLNAAMQDPWISQQISNDVAIYANSPKGNMPQMIIGTNITYGTPLIEDIYKIVEEQLGLSRSGGQ